MDFADLLDRPARAVITVSSWSLIVAVVCFGALESSGTTHTANGSFGGAFAAFLAAFAALGALYLKTSEPNTINRRERRRADFVFEEIVKIVDFRSAVAPADHQQVQLTDYRVLTKESDKDRYVFEYGTNGFGISGSSLSHPGAARWEDVSAEELRPGEARHTAHAYEMTLDLDDLATGQSTRVMNELTFLDAFLDDPEWFHTHLEEPTGRLTFVFLFPEGHTPYEIRGESKGSGRTQQWDKPDDQPVRMRDGNVVYWRINAPDAEEYRMEWHWNPPIPSDLRAGAQSSVTN